MLLLLGRSFYVLLVSHLIQNQPLLVMRNYAWNTCLFFEGIEDFYSLCLRKFQRTFSHLLSILMNYTWIIRSFSAYNILIVFESTSNILFLVHSTMRRLAYEMFDLDTLLKAEGSLFGITFGFYFTPLFVSSSAI